MTNTTIDPAVVDAVRKKLTIGAWYSTKSGALCRLDSYPNDKGYATVTSAFKDHIVQVPVEQLMFFTPASAPDLNPTIEGKKFSGDNHPVYAKYKHVIPGSVYKSDGDQPGIRCKIKCTKCGTERDIKVQDAFQIKLCGDCKKIKKPKKSKNAKQ